MTFLQRAEKLYLPLLRKVRVPGLPPLEPGRRTGLGLGQEAVGGSILEPVLRCRARREGAGERVVHHCQLDLAKPLDLIAQPGRLLEFEIGGGIAHSTFEIGNNGFQIVADGRPVFGKTGIDEDVIALVDG